MSNAAHFPLYRSLFSSSSSSSVSSSSVSSRGVRVLDDGALDNERRLGAVADLREAVRHARREPDVLVAVAGDTLFEKSVSVKVCACCLFLDPTSLVLIVLNETPCDGRRYDEMFSSTILFLEMLN